MSAEEDMADRIEKLEEALRGLMATLLYCDLSKMVMRSESYKNAEALLTRRGGTKVTDYKWIRKRVENADDSNLVSVRLESDFRARVALAALDLAQTRLKDTNNAVIREERKREATLDALESEAEAWCRARGLEANP